MIQQTQTKTQRDETQPILITYRSQDLAKQHIFYVHFEQI